MTFERQPTALAKRMLLQAAFLVAAGASVPAFAGLDVELNIGAPPAPQVETVPVVPAGQVWAPGYYEYVHGSYVWRRGHLMAAHPGEHWVAPTWERRGDHHHFEEGHWEHGEHR